MKAYKTNEYNYLYSRSTLRTTLHAPRTYQRREGRWRIPTIRKGDNNQIDIERGGMNKRERGDVCICMLSQGREGRQVYIWWWPNVTKTGDNCLLKLSAYYYLFI